MARKKQQSSEGGWIVTYSDTVTLLLTFFVLLYSMSNVDSTKFKQISQSFQSMFNGKNGQSILEFNTSTGEVPLVGKPQLTTDSNNNEGQALLEDIISYVEENNLQSDVQIFQNEKGFNIQMKDSVLFDTGKSQLKPESLNVLEKVYNLLSKLNNKIIIQGHTDNMPISTPQFPSNWYLSSSRALSVLDYFLVTKKHPNPDIFSMEACGEFYPIAPNDTPENRAKNRRVNILIVTDKKE